MATDAARAAWDEEYLDKCCGDPLESYTDEQLHIMLEMEDRADYREIQRELIRRENERDD